MLETTRRKRVISHKRVKQMALLMTNITTITSMATLIISTGITVKTNPIKLIIQIVQKMEAQMAKNSKKLKLPLPQNKMKQQSNNLQLDQFKSLKRSQRNKIRKAKNKRKSNKNNKQKSKKTSITMVTPLVTNSLTCQTSMMNRTPSPSLRPK